MVFSSSVFLFVFLPIVIAGYFLCNGKVRNLWLLLTSLYFYAWGEPKYILLMLISILFNYVMGIGIELLHKRKNIQKVLLAVGCIIDLGALLLFKYADFFVDNVNLLFGKTLQPVGLLLPIGISFYTFQTMSYIIDVYRKEVKAQRNIIYLGLYVSFFAQLIAGPIVRYSDIEKQIASRKISLDHFYSGMMRFILGFSKKVLLADNVAVTANWAFGLQDLSAPAAWTGIIAYTLQIYLDFSGYSDMAIGIGKIFGFDFMENFNFPYISASIREFWRRWHISLSTWFRDYVYIPLGGSRKGNLNTYRNLFIIFFLTGFWHGASWNFIIWGMYYGIFLILERIFLGKLLEKLPRFFGHCYTLAIVMFGWIFFRAEGLTAAIHYIKALFRFNSDSVLQWQITVTGEQVFFIMAGILCSLPLGRWIGNRIRVNPWISDIAKMAVFICAIFYLVGRGFSPFLYFRF